MHDDRVRARLRAALGDPPPGAREAVQRLEAHVHPAPAPGDVSWRRPAMTVAAGVLTVAVVVTVVGTHIALRRSPAASPAAAGLGCRLPLVVKDPHFPNVTQAAGFVSPSTGAFQPDPGAVAGDLPFPVVGSGGTWQAVTYDPVLKRWLPVRQSAVAPDHSGYAYVVDLDSTFELHVYDVRRRADRVVWSGSGGPSGFPVVWEADGIHLLLTPPEGGPSAGWVVPSSGDASHPGPYPPASAEYQRTNVGTRFAVGQYEAQFHGRPIVFVVHPRSVTPGGSPSPTSTPVSPRTIGPQTTPRPAPTQDGSGFVQPLNGYPYTVYVARPPGSTTSSSARIAEPRTVIHSGVVGDATDFDPTTFVADGDRLWAASADGTALWLWTEKDGLRRLPLNAGPKGGKTSSYWVAGPCV
jgi:hypothetical protein